MMRRNLYILAIASLLSGNYVFAQDALKQWSLEECIQYAIEHNIDLKQKEQEQESRKVDLHTSKYSWLPALNGVLVHDHPGFRRGASELEALSKTAI